MPPALPTSGLQMSVDVSCQPKWSVTSSMGAYCEVVADGQGWCVASRGRGIGRCVLRANVPMAVYATRFKFPPMESDVWGWSSSHVGHSNRWPFNVYPEWLSYRRNSLKEDPPTKTNPYELFGMRIGERTYDSSTPEGPDFVRVNAGDRIVWQGLLPQPPLVNSAFSGYEAKIADALAFTIC